MSKRARVRRVVSVEDGIARSRCVRKGSRMKYDPQLQEILDCEGRPALERTAVRWFHGFLRMRP